MSASRYKSLAWYPILAVGISMISLITIKTARDSVFFTMGGLQQLPLVYMMVAFVSIPAAMVHLEAMKRWGARRVRIGVFVLTGLMFLGFVPFVALEQKIAMSILFALVPAAFAAVFAAAWLLAADLLEGADERLIGWAYSRVGVGSLLGGIAGGLVANALALLLAPRFLVAAGAGLLLIAGGIVWRGHRRCPEQDFGLDPSPSEEPDGRGGLPPIPATLDLLRHRYVVVLIGISGLGAIAALFIDFQFYALATQTGNLDMTFFASFYTALNVAALILQLAAGPWIQSRFGVGGALLILPAALLGGAGMVMLNATLLSRSLLKVTEGGLKASIHRTIWEQVFLPIGHRGREMAKVLVDGLFPRMSEGMAAGVLYLWLAGIPSLEAKALNLSWISWATVLVILAWVVLTRVSAVRRCSRIVTRDNQIRLPDS